jgi:hypothetical protein
MRPTHSQHEDYLAHRPLPGVSYEHNAYVEVVAGDHAGDRGSLISVEELGSDPLYLVELESGRDAEIRQSWLRLCP